LGEEVMEFEGLGAFTGEEVRGRMRESVRKLGAGKIVGAKL
jgi:hypothetical protein